MKTFVTRTITGFFFALTLVFSVVYGGIVSSALFLTVSIMGVLEFVKIIKPVGVKPHTAFTIFSTIVIHVLYHLHNQSLIEPYLLSIILVLFFIPFVIELYSKSAHPFSNIGFTLLSQVYISIPLALFVSISYFKGTFSYQVPLGILFIIWASDSGAYVVGSLLGKNKLFERISPNKSWEGSIGGGIFSLFIAYVLSLYFSDLSQSQWLILALIVIVSGSFGDLVESLLKRSLNIKDSGNILPGHGGILDRFDALMFAVPFAWVYLKLIG